LKPISYHKRILLQKQLQIKQRSVQIGTYIRKSSSLGVNIYYFNGDWSFLVKNQRKNQRKDQIDFDNLKKQ
jgi:hypothetical protein